MPALVFQPVETEAQIALLHEALCALSDDLGDIHAAGIKDLGAALLAPVPAAYGMLAQDDSSVKGAALFSPVFSTVLGAPGLYVSDLWVSPLARGRGLGRALLAQAARRAQARWRAEWMTLAVYRDSQSAQRFYHRLGFAPQTTSTLMRLDARAMGELTTNLTTDLGTNLSTNLSKDAT